MKEEYKEAIYHREDFYLGMGAIVRTPNWHTLTRGQALSIADRTTSGAADHGDIGEAFVKLCEERERRNDFMKRKTSRKGAE